MWNIFGVQQVPLTSNTFLVTALKVAPGNLTLVNKTSHNLTITWSSLPSIHIDPSFTGYMVNYSRKGFFRSFSAYFNTTVVLPDLQPYTFYDIQVAGVNLPGPGPASDLFERTDEDGKIYYFSPSPSPI